jgi:sugar-specific transcriptional regulator TrmB
MNTEGLKTLGLTESMIKTYLAILKTPSATINKIHEKTGLERRTIYDIINKLIEKGMITYTVEKGKKTYQSVNPNKLLEETKKIKNSLEEFENSIPDLTDLYKASKQEINAEIFRGKDGFKAIWEDMLNQKENYFIGGGWYIVEKLPNFWANYNKRRIKAGVKWYNLLRHEYKKQKFPETKLIQAKFLPEEFSGSPAVIFIYGNKVVNVLWGEDFFAFSIESKEIADNYKRYHKYLWNNIAE